MNLFQKFNKYLSIYPAFTIHNKSGLILLYYPYITPLTLTIYTSTDNKIIVYFRYYYTTLSSNTCEALHASCVFSLFNILRSCLFIGIMHKIA